MPYLSALYRYPVKSMRGQSVEQATLAPRGFEGDRRLMLVDEDGGFITGRRTPQLLTIVPTLEGSQLTLSLPDGQTHQSEMSGQERLSVSVWKDQVNARIFSADACAFLSDYLTKTVRLVIMDRLTQRPVNPDYARPGDEVSFADAFPFLIACESSLDDLSTRAGEPIGMGRFRPNIVISGTEAWEEDNWSRLTIGGTMFEISNGCERCVLTTRDPITGTPHTRTEPLRTLATFRKGASGKVFFGVNAIARGSGTLKVGDPVRFD